jgi:transcriptional regulator with XRE-family HTH domain
MKGLGNRLKQRGKALGLSGAEVARRTGLDPSRYNHYLNGRYSPDLDMLVRISRVLDTTPHVLMGLDEAGNSEKTDMTPSDIRRRGLMERTLAAAESLDDHDLETLARLSETFRDARRRG